MDQKAPIPVDIVLAPEWWNKHTGITFDRDFFFHPLKRVESEQRMEKELYERWGKHGLGADRDKAKPEIGAVHLAAGFMLSEMLGCEVRYFNSIAAVIERFTGFVASQTGTTSISVTRSVRHLPKPVFLHSECSHTMVSCEDYEQFLMPIDARWSREKEFFGIHYCGDDPHRYAESFARLPKLAFLDLGWGGDVAHLRKYLPGTFFNLRLSPVELVNMTVEEIQTAITKLVSESGNPELTGVCCSNIDDKVTDEKIDAIFEAVGSINTL